MGDDGISRGGQGDTQMFMVKEAVFKFVGETEAHVFDLKGKLDSSKIT